jgi:hypothetical protein
VLTRNGATPSTADPGSPAELLAAAAQELRRLSPHSELTPEGYADRVPDDVLQDLLALAVRFFAAKRAAGDLDAFGDNHVTATEVAIAATGMLQAVNLELFELTLWNGWGRA